MTTSEELDGDGRVRRPPPPRTAGPRLFWVLMGLAGGVFAASLVLPLVQGEQMVTINADAGGDPAATGAPVSPDGISASPTGNAASEHRLPGSTGSTGSTGTAGSANPGSPRSPGTPTTGPSVGPTEVGDRPPIHIGIGDPNLGALATLGPSFDFGSVRDHFEAIREDWIERGLIPVNGHDVVFHYRQYGLLSAEEQRAACTGWSDDDHVTAVIALQYFFATECVPVEKQIPLILDSGVAQHMMDRAHPWMFTLSSDTGHVGRNWIQWAHERGMLEGKLLGLYSDGGELDGIADDVRATLDRLGYTLTEDIETTEATTGGPQDNVAAQRFATSQVDVAMLAVSSIAQTNFMQTAESLTYRPTYIGADFFSLTTDTATETFPADHYDGTYAMTTFRHGELSAGLGANAQQQECIDRYAAHSGKRITQADRPAEWFVLNVGCDTAAVLLEGLQRAAAPITKQTLVGGLELIADKQLGVVSDVTYTASDHGGSQQMRTIRWHASCLCWKAVDDFVPWLLP